MSIWSDMKFWQGESNTKQEEMEEKVDNLADLDDAVKEDIKQLVHQALLAGEMIGQQGGDENNKMQWLIFMNMGLTLLAVGILAHVHFIGGM